MEERGIFCEDLDKYIVLYAVIHTVSVILNGSVFWILLKNALFDFPSNRFLLSLSGSHLLASLSTLVISASWIDGIFNEEGIFDAIYVHVLFATSIFNTLMITCIACERYITIARPMRYKSIVTSTRCSLTVLLAWLLSTCVTVAPLINFDRDETVTPEEEGLYFPLMFISVTLFAFLIMCVCYYIIFTIAKEKCQHIQIGQLTNESISSDWASSAYPSQGEGEQGIQSKPTTLLQHVLVQARMNSRNLDSYRLKQFQNRPKQNVVQTTPRKTVGTILALLGSLLLTQFPVISVFYDSGLWRMSMLMLSCSAITNPVLYGFLNRKIRTQLWKALIKKTNWKVVWCSACQEQGKNYPEILKDIVLNATIPLESPKNLKRSNDKLDAIPEREEPPKNPADATKETEICVEEDENIEPKSPLPRKDSHDSGADLTFSSDEEEEEEGTQMKQMRMGIMMETEGGGGQGDNLEICDNQQRDDAECCEGSSSTFVSDAVA